MSDGSPQDSAVEPNAAPPKKDKLSVKDILSLVFSASALTISAASYYMANIRVRDAALARVADMHVIPESSDDPANADQKGQIALSVAFINSGNRPAIITGAVYQLSGEPNLDSGGFGGEVSVAADTFPFVLPPTNLRLVTVKIPISAMLANFGNGSDLSAADGENPSLRKFYGGLRYSAIDSSGALHTNWSGMQFQMHVDKTNWKSLKPVRPDATFTITPLFGDSPE